jgi:hypothetical protein
VPKRPELGTQARHDMGIAQRRANVLEQLTLLARESWPTYEHKCPVCFCVRATRTSWHKPWQCPYMKHRCLKCLQLHKRDDCPLARAWKAPNTPWHNKACSACTLAAGKGSFHPKGQQGGPKCKSLGANFIYEYCMTLYAMEPARIRKLVHLVDVKDKFAYWTRPSADEPTDSQVLEFGTWLYAPVAPESKLSKALVLLLLDNWSAGLGADLKRDTISLLDTGSIH